MNLKKTSLLLALLLSLSTFVAQTSFAVPTDPTNPVTTPTDPTAPVADLELDTSNDDTSNPIPNKISLANGQFVNVTLPVAEGGTWTYSLSKDNIISWSVTPDSMLKDVDPVTGKITLSHSFLSTFIPFDEGKVTMTFYYIFPDHQLSTLVYKYTLDIVK